LNKRLVLLPCLLILSALVLSACGGGGGSGDESQIEEAIETSATSADPSNCTKFETLKFDEQGAQVEGAAAIKACEKEAKEPEEKAESVEVSNIEVNGSKASAEAAITGGGFDGQTLEVNLVKDGEQWKLDELAGFAKLDQSKVVAALAKQFEGDKSVNKEIATCIENGFEEASQAEVEELLLSGSSKPIEELAAGCVS
jgi:predicted small secreted protein